MGHKHNLVLIVAGYPIDLHTHDNISYQPPFIIERLVNSYTPSCKSVRGPIWSPRATMHSRVIMLTFATISKRTGIHFPSIVVYPTLSLPNQWDLASSFNMGIRFLGHMHDATHLTFWEEHFPRPFWAALGASILPHSVPPLSLNPSYPSGPASRWDSHAWEVPSLITGVTSLLLLFIMVHNTGCLNMWWEQGSSGGGWWGIPHTFIIIWVKASVSHSIF